MPPCHCPAVLQSCCAKQFNHAAVIHLCHCDPAVLLHFSRVTEIQQHCCWSDVLLKSSRSIAFQVCCWHSSVQLHFGCASVIQLCCCSQAVPFSAATQLSSRHSILPHCATALLCPDTAQHWGVPRVPFSPHFFQTAQHHSMSPLPQEAPAWHCTLTQPPAEPPQPRHMQGSRVPSPPPPRRR